MLQFFQEIQFTYSRRCHLFCNQTLHEFSRAFCHLLSANQVQTSNQYTNQSYFAFCESSRAFLSFIFSQSAANLTSIIILSYSRYSRPVFLSFIWQVHQNCSLSQKNISCYKPFRERWIYQRILSLMMSFCSLLEEVVHILGRSAASCFVTI